MTIITETEFWQLVGKLLADRTSYVYEQEFKVAEYIQDVQKVLRFLIEKVDTTQVQYIKNSLSISLAVNVGQFATIAYLIYLLS